MKTARIYKELADLARARGYDQVTDDAVHDWRKRGMLPSARGLGRRKRRPGRIPASLRDRVLAICRYHYDLGITDLRIVTIRLWLDGAEIELSVVRAALLAIRGLTERMVATFGSSARRADPHDPDADVDATALAIVTSPLARAFGGEVTAPDELHSAAFDAVRLALERQNPDDPTDLTPLARAIGLGRAHTEAPPGVEPWLPDDPAKALGGAMTALFGAAAVRAITEVSDDALLAARETTDRLVEVLQGASVVLAAFKRGAFGLGFLRDVAPRPEFPALVLYLAVLQPSDSAGLAAAFTPGQLAEWRQAAVEGEAWLREHPDLAKDAEVRGLLAVVQEWTAEQRLAGGGPNP